MEEEKNDFFLCEFRRLSLPALTGLPIMGRN